LYGSLTTSQIYLALFLGIIPTPAKIQDEILPVVRTSRRQRGHLIGAPKCSRANSAAQLPFWAIVSFGAYLLFKLGWNVMTFNDVPAAHKELMGEIEMARDDLRRKGVDID